MIAVLHLDRADMPSSVSREPGVPLRIDVFGADLVTDFEFWLAVDIPMRRCAGLYHGVDHLGGGDLEELRDLGQMVRMARKGPAWPRVFAHQSKHYRVRSDIDARICQEASRILEEAFVMYQADLGWLTERTPKRSCAR